MEHCCHGDALFAMKQEAGARDTLRLMKFGTHIRSGESFDLMQVFGLGVANWFESNPYKFSEVQHTAHFT